MKTLGIVAEYNPFHAGHKYHIEESKLQSGADTVVVVMSGDYVQRGEPAAIDKYSRAKMALLQGADLVVELPTKFILGDASTFAGAGVAILDAMKVDYMSFGSEEGKLEKLEKLGKLLAEEDEAYLGKLKEGLDEGKSYAAARSDACEFFIDGSREILHNSNNILAVEYLRQIHLQNSKIKPLTIGRKGLSYGDLEFEGSKFPSAAAIRNAMGKNLEINGNKGILTEESAAVIDKIDIKVKCELNDFYEILAAKILTSKREELEKLYGASEGITNKIYNELLGCNSIEELDKRVISKRYTTTRLHRIYLQLILGIYKEELKSSYEKFINGEGSYIRVLGFNEKGSKNLRNMKKALPEGWTLLTNINKEKELLNEDGIKLLDFETNAASLYNIINGKDSYRYSDYIMKPIIL